MANSTQKYTQTTLLIVALVAFVLGAGIGAGGYIMISGGSGEASDDVRNVAPTLSLAQATETPTEEATTEATEVVAEATTEATTVVAEATAQAVMTEEAVTRALYRINPDNSQATFTLQEDLNGQRIDVIGVTNQVGGDIIVNSANPAESQVGAILINARTLATDNNFRNQALRGRILRSAEDAYEFITFTPTAIKGLDNTPYSGGELTFTIEGDLQIIEVTRPVVFEVTLTQEGDSLKGTASTVVMWRDFNITIPQVPSVANITEEVTLKLDFVADLVESE